ncbi:MAG: ABC transporter permease [Micrococcaceae bacterium]
MSNTKLSPDHFVAPVEETPLQVTDKMNEEAAPTSMWNEAWQSLRKKPMFIVSSVLIVFLIIVGLFPDLFSKVAPNAGCILDNVDSPPAKGHPLGFTSQGCDVYSRVIHGAGASLTVGVATTIAVLLLGGLIGALAGYYGGLVDTLLSRLGDIFFALPLILGALVLMQTPQFKDHRSVWTVVFILTIFSWPNMARIMRGAVVTAKNSEYVTAAKSLGVSRFAILIKHVIPNAMAPVIVTATMNLGIFIVAEATLSFLGIGLPGDTMSWGNDISAARLSMRTNPGALFWPSLALSVTVLSFIMLGDAVRDALDPKARER